MDKVRRVVLQPEEGIFLELLLGLPEGVDDSGNINELISSIPGLQELIDDGISEAKKAMSAEGLSEYALVGRYNVPGIVKGIVSHKGGLEFLEEGESGLITAYLPEQKIFAVWFSQDKWITFKDWTEEEFNDKFHSFVVPINDL